MEYTYEKSEDIEITESVDLHVYLDNTDKMMRNIINTINDQVEDSEILLFDVNWSEEKFELKTYQNNKNEFPKKLVAEFNNKINNKINVVCPNGLKQDLLCKNFDSTYLSYLLNKIFKELGSYFPLKIENKIIGLLFISKYEFIKELSEKISISLRNSYFYESNFWKPTSNETTQTIGDICNAIVDESKKKTGADDGKVRLVCWKDKYLVPGASKWHGKKYLDPRVYIRERSKGLAGSVIESGDSIFWNNLNDQEIFNDVIIFADAKKKDCKELNDNLKDIIKLADPKLDDYKINKLFNNHQCGDNLNSLKNTRKELCERLNYLKKLENDKRKDSLELQIMDLDNLYESWKNYLKELEEWKCGIAIPIFLNNEPVGVLNLHSKIDNWFNTSDHAICKALANQVGYALLEHQNKSTNSILDFVKITTEKISEVNEPITFKNKIITHLNESIINFLVLGDEQLNSDNIFTLLYKCKRPMSPERLISYKNRFDEQFERVYRPSQINESLIKEYLLLNIKIRGDGIGYESILKAKSNPESTSFLVRGNIENAISRGSESAINHGILTTACLPLIFERKVYGLIYVHIYNNMHFFTQIEEEILKKFAHNTAIVLKNLNELYHQEEERKKEILYEKRFGNELLIDCINTARSDEIIEYDPANYFAIINGILYDSKDEIIGKFESDASASVRRIVERIVEELDLSQEICTKYCDFGKQQNLLSYSASYRDHYFHPFHTFLLGFLILSKAKKMNNSPFFDESDSGDVFLKKWFITALWHDIAYTAEKGSEFLEGYIKHKLKFDIKASQSWGSLFRSIETTKLIDVLTEKFDEQFSEIRILEFRTWLYKQLEEFNDHGILSAMFLLKEFPNDQLIVECALAISLHNYNKAYNDTDSKNVFPQKNEESDQLIFDKFPLAFLLSFCDTAQEWGRPKHDFTPDHIKYKQIFFEQEKVIIELNYDLEKLRTYIVNDLKKKKINVTNNRKDKEVERISKKEFDEFKNFIKCWNFENSKWIFEIKPIKIE